MRSFEENHARWIDGEPALDGFLKRVLAARSAAP